jgi:hypothetical protein
MRLLNASKRMLTEKITHCVLMLTRQAAGRSGIDMQKEIVGAATPAAL